MKKRKFYNFLIAPLLGAFFVVFAALTPQKGADISAFAEEPQATAVAEETEKKGLSEKVARGVKVDGIFVGGMQIRKAERLLRAVHAKRVPMLVVETQAGRYSFTYPEIGFSDNFEEILSTAEKRGEYSSTVRYRLNEPERQTEYICANNRVSPLDAEARFSSAGFEYEAEREGIVCDADRLKKDIERALSSEAKEGTDGVRRFPVVSLHVRRIAPRRTEAAVKKDTVKISSFTTYFNADDRGRSENIALAAARIDGTVIRPNEEFSFNGMVGKRTKENGFKEAKIIQDGQFIAGIGGGVCQASTTLYNAAVLAGLKITARRSHSLAVHYVDPSRDAMVSSSSDFRFKNPKTYPVYLSAKVRGDGLTVTFYGRDEGYRYEIISVKTGEIPPPEPLEKPGVSGESIREGKPGLTSEAYLETYLYGKLIERKKISSDKYGAIRGVVGKKSA